MSTRMRNILLGACFFYVVLVCLVPTTTWADFDKTIVDLQRGRPEAASRYYRPRAAQLYRWDKTEVKRKGLAKRQSFVEQKQLVFFIVFELCTAAFGRLDDDVQIIGFWPKRPQVRDVTGRYHDLFSENRALVQLPLRSNC